jgi:hypothetical protein
MRVLGWGRLTERNNKLQTHAALIPTNPALSEWLSFSEMADSVSYWQQFQLPLATNWRIKGTET